MLDHTTPDRELVRRWQAGDNRERVSSILQQRYARELAGSFRRMDLGDEICSDLTQETLLRAFRGLEKFQRDSSFRTWLHQVARNVARKLIRSRKTIKRTGQAVPIDEIADDSREKQLLSRSQTVEDRDGPLDQLLLDEQKRQVWAALSELPAADQTMVRLRIWQDLSVRETALALNKPEGTIKSGWARIRGTLKEKLGPQFSDLPP